jgi:hypothetical protein
MAVGSVDATNVAAAPAKTAAALLGASFWRLDGKNPPKVQNKYSA